MLNFEDDFTPPSQPAFRPAPPVMPQMPAQVPQLQTVTTN